MALIVEDGSIVADADSYGTVSGLKNFAAKRGTDLTENYTDAQLEVAMIKATDYLESKRDRYQGEKVDSTQSLQFPRSGVYVDNILIATNAIPNELISAQYFLAMSAVSEDLQPDKSPDDKGRVTSETVEGAVSVDYEYVESVTDPIFVKADALLQPLYEESGRAIRG